MLSYKEFNNWCNQRAADGKWGYNEAIICLDIVRQIDEIPIYRFIKRNRLWTELEPCANNILTKTNEKIKEVDNSDGY